MPPRSRTRKHRPPMHIVNVVSMSDLTTITGPQKSPEAGAHCLNWTTAVKHALALLYPKHCQDKATPITILAQSRCIQDSRPIVDGKL